MLHIMLFVIVILLIILILAYDPARRLFLSALNSIIAIWLTLLILAAFIAAFIFFGSLGWKYMKPTFHSSTIFMYHKLQRHLIFIKDEKDAWIFVAFVILSITLLILLISLLGKKIKKRKRKGKGK